MHALLPTLIALTVANAASSLALWLFSRTLAARLALLTSFLMFVTLMFTNWGISSPDPKVSVFWGGAVLAVTSQVACVASAFRSPNKAPEKARSNRWQKWTR